MRKVLIQAQILLLLVLLALLPVAQSPLTAAGASPAVMSVFALGDVTLGRYVGATIADHAGDFGYPFAGLAADLHASDLGIANLEGVLRADPPDFRAPAVLNGARLIGDLRAAPALARAGLNVLGLANNHVLDGGPTALLATTQALADAGVLAVGAGPDPAAARRPQYRTVQGLRVAVLARSAVPNNPPAPDSPPGDPTGPALIDPQKPADLADLGADLRAARAKADVVILLMHWGTEYQATVSADQRRVAAVAADSGVDLVVGAHPHVAAPVELLGSRPTVVAWSLGNAVFDQQWRPDLRQGLALRARFDRAGLVALDVQPLWRAGVQPRRVPPTDANGQAVLARIWPDSASALRAQQLIAGADGGYTLLPALAYRRAEATPAALGADLDGDSAAERVILAGGQISVRRATVPPPHLGIPVGATLLWQTPADWRVDGLALGTADTRAGPEIAFTVWKPTARTEIHAAELRGQVRQHFFLFGWRRGAINPVWNSSALPDPFRAFTFGPPAANGTARVIGLESRYTALDGPVAVTVWVWNGFGYTLDWRSPTRFAAQQVWTVDGTVLIH
jgi:poly-gamma-glutamate synthesis protein (capsule biosynthesis protein)